MFKVSNNRMFGMTLSEVLIVMTILGVVFVLGFGVIIADYSKSQTLVQLEKTFSTLEQLFRVSVSHNLSASYWDFPISLSEDSSYEFFTKYLKPHLILYNDCKNSTEGKCDFTFKELNGTEQKLNSTWVRFFLSDGTFIAMQPRSDVNYKVVYFYVDINGKKRVNLVGRDVFIFEYWIENNEYKDWVGRVLPYGHQYSKEEIISTSDENNCNREKNGNYCGALIIKDQWQIRKGYPWPSLRVEKK